MPYLNPLANALLQGQTTQQQLSTDKTRQIRRQQVQSRATGVEGDRFEHQVESTEETPPIEEELPRERGEPRKRRGKRKSNDTGDEQDEGGLDVKA